MHMYPVPLLPEVAQLTVAAETGTNAVRVAIKSLGWHVTLTCNALKAKGTIPAILRYKNECTRRVRCGNSPLWGTRAEANPGGAAGTGIGRWNRSTVDEERLRQAAKA